MQLESQLKYDIFMIVYLLMISVKMVIIFWLFMQENLIIINWMEVEIKTRPTPEFLNKLFAQLEKKKTKNQDVKNIPSDTVYKGFKTIPIQKLEHRKEHT